MWTLIAVFACRRDEPPASHAPDPTPPADTTHAPGDSGHTSQTGETGEPPELAWVWLKQGAPDKGLGLVSDGTVRCWGHNEWVDACAPSDATFSQVHIGTDGACGIRTSGEVACWCWDRGPGTGIEPFCDDEPPGTDYVRVVVGAGYGCAQRTDGTLRCFGEPHPPPPTEPVLDFDIEDDASCAVFLDGRLECWELPSMWETETPALTLPTGTFSRVAIGRAWVCGLDEAGDMRCGGPTWEHADTGAAEWELAPELVPGPFTAVDSTYLVTCGLREDGHPGCWYGNSDAAVWGVVPDLAFAQLGLGESGGCGLLVDGTPTCWSSVPDVPTVDIPEL